MPESACVCHHSYTAHLCGSRKGCSFCNCQQYQDPGQLAPQTKPLSESAQRALNVLCETAAFKHVPPERLRDIAEHGRRRLYLTGAVVMLQGDESDTLHVLVKGKVKVEHQIAPGKSILLAELEPGDIVGEMGVLNGDLRSATVTAASDVESLEVSAAQLKQVFQQDPEVLLAIMKVINERLKTTEDLVETSIKVALAQLGSDK